MITWFHDTTILGCIKTILRYWCHCVDVYIGQFICTQVSHLQFPVNNYLGIIHNNTCSIKLKYFLSSLRWQLLRSLVPQGRCHDFKSGTKRCSRAERVKKIFVVPPTLPNVGLWGYKQANNCQYWIHWNLLSGCRINKYTIGLYCSIMNQQIRQFHAAEAQINHQELGRSFSLYPLYPMGPKSKGDIVPLAPPGCAAYAYNPRPRRWPTRLRRLLVDPRWDLDIQGSRQDITRLFSTVIQVVPLVLVFCSYSLVWQKILSWF